MQQLHDLIAKRKTELFSQIHQQTDVKLKNLEAQKDEVETVQTQLVSCLSFVSESLRTGSKGEVMKVKKTVMKQVKEMINHFNPDKLPPCEPANVKFVSSPDLTPACQQFGAVYLQQSSPKECYATGEGLKEAKPNQIATAILHTADSKGKAMTIPVETLTCELVSELTCEKLDCSVKKVQTSQYEISYQVACKGPYLLHIKVEDEHIKGSPFAVSVRNLDTGKDTIKIISDVKDPGSIAIDKKGNVIVSESKRACISVFSPTGEKLQSFGSEQLSIPRGVAVDDDGNILVVEKYKQCILKFTSDGKLITIIGKYGSSLEFNMPIGAAIHPHNKKLYVADQYNHRIKVLNSDFTFYNTFGRYGNDDGQFNYCTDVAFDSIGNVYVADAENHRIQVFTAEGNFLRKFGKEGTRNGELSTPSRVDVSVENVVYVTEVCNHRVSMFTCDGKFLASFGTCGSGSGQFNEPHGIVVDKNGVIYVCDSGNNRLQLFY